MLLFFFQAEDGIRDIGVTGVQTCALPISSRPRRRRRSPALRVGSRSSGRVLAKPGRGRPRPVDSAPSDRQPDALSRMDVAMPASLRRVGIRTYRNHRLEVLDDGADGWAVAIHVAGEGRTVVLRNSVPNGLDVLLAEARARVDRRLDGGAWQRDP